MFSSLSFQFKKNDFYIFEKEEWELSKMIEAFRSLIRSKKKDQELVFFCIGSDKNIADCFGPLVGTMLGRGYFVYGILGDTINAKNLNEKLAMIKEFHNNPFVVAIDASVSPLPNEIGTLTIRKGPLKPGSGIGKEHLEEVGDVSITMVTAKTNHLNTLPFNVPLGDVYYNAEKIAFMVKSSV